MKNSLIKILLAVAATFACTGCAVNLAVNQPTLPRRYICQRVLSPLIHDGKLNDSSWQKARWTTDFVDIEGERRPPPGLRTRVKMLWDDEYLYIGAEMEEPHLQASLTKRDSVVYQDNDFEVFLDPDGDSHRYCELEVNALGTEWDLVLNRPYRDHGRANNDWNITGLLCSVNLGGSINDPSDKDEGWSVEIAIPWKAIEDFANHKGPPHDGEQWRVNFSRVQWRWNVENQTYVKRLDSKGKKLPEYNWVWSPQGVISMHRPESWGFVQFSVNPVGSRCSFAVDPEEEVKDSLRQFYYAQKSYFRNQKSYCLDLNSEKLRISAPYRRKRLPTVVATTGGYQMSLPRRDGKGLWFIDDQGLTWSQSN